MALQLQQDPNVLAAAQNLIAIYNDLTSTPQMRNVARIHMKLYLELAEAEQAEKLKAGAA